jgi:hypothetical protein
MKNFAVSNFFLKLPGFVAIKRGLINLKTGLKNRLFLKTFLVKSSDCVSGNLMTSAQFNFFARKLALPIALILVSLSSYAQITNLRFTNAPATYEPITGGTSLVAAGTAIGAVSPVTNIGFTFKFQGEDYTQFSVNAAGLLKLGSVAVTTESANSAITATNRPKIYALWDAFSTGTAASGGGVVSSLTGTAPNRVLTVQWRVNSTGATTASGVNFQVALFETSNKIEFN